MRKPAFCICENKDANQLHGNGEADQHLCFQYIDSAIPLLSINEISSLQPSCVVFQPAGMCEDRFSHNEAHLAFYMFRERLSLIFFKFNFSVLDKCFISRHKLAKTL